MTVQPKTGALVPRAGTSLALPDELIEQARNLADKALSKRTREEYARCWRKFERWCAENKQQPLPCALGTLAGYITWLATGQGKGKPLAISSINQTISAIKMAHRDAGAEFNTDHPALQKVWTGARREIASKRTIRRVSPIMSSDLREILEMLSQDNLRGSRDAALLAVGWGAARRRSELVGLDWHEPGGGTGYMRSDADGLTLVLLTGKTHQDQAHEYYITREAAPFLCSVVEHWVAFAKIERGTPVFRPIVKGKGGADAVGATRLDAHSVSRIVKRRLYMLLRQQEADKAMRKRLSARDLKAKVASFSSHSMRAGHVTDAAERGVPDHHTMRQTGHKTKAMLSVYSRVTDAKKKSSLRGAGL